MQAWAMELGQRIMKVHGDSQQFADCLTKMMTPQAAHGRALDFDRCSNLSNIDEEVQKIAAHQTTVSDVNTFTNTFPVNMRVKFVMIAT